MLALLLITLDKPLVSQFLLDGRIQKVEYESLPNICFTCGKYGHNKDLCPNSNNDGGNMDDLTCGDPKNNDDTKR